MPNIEVLGQLDGPAEGYVTLLTRVHILPGEQVARHTHPGVESTYILEGDGVVVADGFADRPCAAGDWFQLPANVPHSVRIGPRGATVVATYVVAKDKPLVTWL